MILVDQIQHHPNSRPPHHWCHMVSDESFDELHEMAKRLGVPERGFHKDHYDLTPEVRALALELGAVPVSSKELVRRRVRSH